MSHFDIEFHNISVRNFLSYGNATTILDISKPGTTLIVGQDLDNTGNGQVANGVGKSLSVDSLIKTPTGWMRMGDAHVGDIVQAYDGTFVPIIGVYPQGKLLTYKVAFSDGRTVDASADHLWQVQSHRWSANRRSNTPRVLNTLEIKKFVDEANKKKKAWYNISVPTAMHPILPAAELPIHPYLLGCLLGDGNMSSNALVLTSADQAIVNRCNQILMEHHDQKLHRLGGGKYNNGYDWHCVNHISSRKHNKNSVLRVLKRIGLHGCTSTTKFIPQVYLDNANEEQKLQLLAGLLDTDGTVGKTKNVSFCSTSKQLAEGVQYIIRSLGGKATISLRHPYFYRDGVKVAGQVAYNVSIQYKSPRSLFTLDRKLDRLSDGLSQYADAGLRIVSIEPHIEQDCQCIAIDHESHLYVTNDFVVTHNTSILQAVVYACYGRAITDIQVDNLINNINKKNMEVTLDFTMGSKCYRIIRARKMKSGPSGNYVRFYHKEGHDFDFTDDDDTSKGHHSRDTDQDIERVLGMKFDLFSRIVVFSAMNEAFFKMPVRSHGTSKKANQTDFIEELFGLTEISQKAEDLQKQQSDTQKIIGDLQVKLEYAEREYKSHDNMIVSTKKRVDNWETNRISDLEDLEERLNTLQGIDIDKELALHEQISELQLKLKTAKSNLSDVEAGLRASAKIIKKNESEISVLKSSKCPYCEQAFTDNEHKIAECTTHVHEAVSEQSTMEDEWDVLTAEIDGLNAEIYVLDAQVSVRNPKTLATARTDSETIKQKIGDLRVAVNPYAEPLDELLSIQLQPVDYTEMNKMTLLLEHQKFLMKLLTKRDSFVRKALLNKNLPYLNSKLQQNLADLGLTHKVEFTHELTAKISQFGRELDFGNLSNGQQARVNIALSFAFRDVLQAMHNRVNICMLDEVLDVGLDAVGVQSAAKMIRRKARDEKLSLYIISHRDEIDSFFDKTLTVQMNKGFSYILPDEDEANDQSITNKDV